MTQGKLNIAIVGLGFGSEFIPIYQHHPSKNMNAICQRTREKLDQIGDAFGVAKRFVSFDDLLGDRRVIHILDNQRKLVAAKTRQGVLSAHV